MKTIICPNYLKPIYLNRLLNNQEIIFDIKLKGNTAVAALLIVHVWIFVTEDIELFRISWLNVGD